MPTASRSNGRRVLSRRCGAMGEDHLPRLGFVGIGWIGRHRMEAVHRAGAAQVAAIADLDADTAQRAGAAVGCDMVYTDLDALLAGGLDLDLDGVVIATPTALHAAQARR